MEQELITVPETPLPEEGDAQEAERRLAALAQKLSQQIEALAQEEADRRQALDEREDALRRREMTALAEEMLKQRELPPALAAALQCGDEDALRAAVSALEDAFRAAVQQGVEARLLSAPPKASALKPLSEMSDEEYYAAVCRND